MADTDGVVKLSDAVKVLDLRGCIGWERELGAVHLNVILADEDNRELMCEADVDPTTGIVWVQLPLETCEVIICQAGEGAKRAELDRWSASDHANRRRSAEAMRAPTGQRRATPPGCGWHQGFKRTRAKDHANHSFCMVCGRWFTDPRPIASATIREGNIRRAIARQSD
jgi:hypothetical protein